MGGGQTQILIIMSGVYVGGGMSSLTIKHYYYMYLFIRRPTVALHLCASAGQKTGFGALRKCKSDASDASDASYIQSQCVCGGVWG